MRAGYTLKNIGRSTLPGWRQLTRDIGNGNVVVYAADRLCPGRMGDRDDPIVRNLAELAACRGRPYDGVWTPPMNLSSDVDDEQGEDVALMLDAEEEGNVVPLWPGA